MPTKASKLFIKVTKPHTYCAVCPKETRLGCSACKTILFCSSACQKLIWSAHRHVCKSDPSVFVQPKLTKRERDFMTSRHGYSQTKGRRAWEAYLAASDTASVASGGEEGTSGQSTFQSQEEEISSTLQASFYRYESLQSRGLPGQLNTDPDETLLHSQLTAFRGLVFTSLGQGVEDLLPVACGYHYAARIEGAIKDEFETHLDELDDSSYKERSREVRVKMNLFLRQASLMETLSLHIIRGEGPPHPTFTLRELHNLGVKRLHQAGREFYASLNDSEQVIVKAQLERAGIKLS